MEISEVGNFFTRVEIDGTCTKSKLSSNIIKKADNLRSDIRIDPDTGIETITREDKFVRLLYPGGKTELIFPDGTHICVSTEKELITISHKDYLAVDILFNKFRYRNQQVIGIGSSYAMKGQKDLYERSFTGRMSIIHLEDGSQLNTYQEMRELPGYNSYRLVGISILYGYDSSTIKFESTGEIVVLDALQFNKSKMVAPEDLNTTKSSGNKSFNKTTIGLSGLILPEPLGMRDVDVDYFIQLFLPQDERESGVYTIDLNEKYLKTRDDQGNTFRLFSNGKTKSHIAISFNLKEDTAEYDKFPRFEGSEYLCPENLDLPVPEVWTTPSLFLIRKDLTATVFYTEDMLGPYWLQKSLAGARVITAQDAATDSLGMLVLTESKQVYADEQEAALPNYLKPLPSTTFGKTDVQKKRFGLRVLRKFHELDENDREFEIKVESLINEFHEEQAASRALRETWDDADHHSTSDVQQEILQNGEKCIFVYNAANEAEIVDTRKVQFIV